MELFLNYDVIFYTFLDIKDYLKNLSTTQVVYIIAKFEKTLGEFYFLF